MAEVTLTSTGPANSNASIMERAEAAMEDLPLGDVKLEDDGEIEEDIFGLNEPEEGEEAEPEEGEEEPEPAKAKAPKLGTKEQPYTVTTLPDAVVKLKIDGEERTVPLREMAEGHMRLETFQKRMSQVSDMTAQAKEAASRFTEQSERLKSSFTQLLSDPEELFSFLDDHAPDALDAVARKMVARLVKEQNDPQARINREYDKKQRELQKQREKFDRDRSEYQRTRQGEETQQKFVAAFKPGYEAGMKRAGYPVVTDEFRATVKGLLTAKQNLTGAPATAKDVADAVVRAARACAAETVEARKPAPPKPSLVPKQAQRSTPQSAQAKSFKQMFRDLGR